MYVVFPGLSIKFPSGEGLVGSLENSTEHSAVCASPGRGEMPFTVGTMEAWGSQARAARASRIGCIINAITDRIIFPKRNLIFKASQSCFE